jgi:diguanylate cyclase (GGDEF)-like protein/PAS domain S-box-containing protein
MSLYGAVAFPLAMIYVLPVFIAERRYGLVALDGACWLFLVSQFFVFRVSGRVRNHVFIGLLYAMTVSFIVSLGPFQARPAWLVMCTVFAGILFGMRGAVVSTFLGAAILWILHGLMGPEHNGWASVYAEPTAHWTMFVFNTSLLALASGLAVGFLFDRLNRTLRSQREATATLSRRGEELNQAYVTLQGEVEQRRIAEEALSRSEAKYRLLAENATDTIWTADMGLNITYISPSVYRSRGYSQQEAISSKLLDHVAPASIPVTTKVLAEELAIEARKEKDLKRSRRVDLEFICKDGSTCWNEVNLTFIRDAQGKAVGIFGVSRDISDRRRAEEEHKESEESLRAFLDAVPHPAFLIDPEGKAIVTNSALVKSLDRDNDNLKGRNILDLSGPGIAERRKAYIKQIVETAKPVIFEDSRGGRDFINYMYPVLDKSGEVSRIAVFALDITERKRAEEQLLHDALYDGLTGLPNRALFIDRLGHALKRPNRKEHDPCAVIFLDLDRFKVVNDSLGHMAGDGLLKEAARRLERCIRPGDTVARLGGDEFVMLFEDVKEVEVAEAIAERIQEILSTPFLIEGTEIRCSASIGIALTSKDYEFPEEVLRDADITMYRAKALGRARYEVFDPAMRLEAAAVLQLENDLRHALERDEFRMQYQPIVRLVDERIVGVEALLRWEHPHRGMVCPDQFITLAEETGLIVPIGEWVLRKACSQMAAWRDRELGEMRVAINISAVQLRQSGFVDFVKKVVQETGTKTELLDLEITESVLMGRNDSIVQTFLGLRALGVKICLDDFGTGYSSLSYLQGLPIDVLKIDRSFTMNLDSVEENRKIIETILMLGKSLGAQVVAEGVETYEQLDYLRSVDCDYGQGFFFSRPVDEEALETIIGIQCGVDDTDGRRQAPINAFSVFPDRF